MCRGDLAEREERALGAAVAEDRQQQVDAPLDAALEPAGWQARGAAAKNRGVKILFDVDAESVEHGEPLRKALRSSGPVPR